MSVEAPFATRFAVIIPNDEITRVDGKYDPQTRTWDHEVDTKTKATLPAERPPTTCSVMTRIGPNHWQTDFAADD